MGAHTQRLQRKVWADAVFSQFFLLLLFLSMVAHLELSKEDVTCWTVCHQASLSAASVDHCLWPMLQELRDFLVTLCVS